MGCCYVRRDGRRAWLGTLAVDPTLHTRGLGRKLLAHAERFVVREWGLRRMEMDVVSSREHDQVRFGLALGPHYLADCP